MAEILTQNGLEVDSIEVPPRPYAGVVVGEVQAVNPHPNADRLQVATVYDGEKTFQVVCGATNCRAGIKSPFARVGASIGGSKLKKGKLRGVDSEGMLCAADELGMGSKSEGILELPGELRTGQDLQEIYGDTLLEISLTPNLGHCFSVLGVARELAAATKTPLKLPEISPLPGGEGQLTPPAEGCPRYAGRVIRGVKVAPSPPWLVRKLEGCGLRSINNIVDITNWVMMELGQPLHPFDMNKIQGAPKVRLAQHGERLTTLDGIDREVGADTLLICDNNGPIAIGGVMGGANSEVDEETVDLLLEGAHFTPKAIRHASKVTGLKTEASKRFERGVDPNGVARALDRATALILQVSGGELTESFDWGQTNFPPKTVAWRPERVNKLLGTDLSVSEMEELLRRLDFKVAEEVGVPTYRFDVGAEIDLVDRRRFGFGRDRPQSDPGQQEHHQK